MPYEKGAVNHQVATLNSSNKNFKSHSAKPKPTEDQPLDNKELIKIRAQAQTQAVAQTQAQTQTCANTNTNASAHTRNQDFEEHCRTL